jgi:hypothetical protein
MIIPVTPAPMIQKYCKPVNAIQLKKLGVSSANPLKITNKGPLSDVVSLNKTYTALDDIEQIDTNVFQVDLVDEDGHPSTYTIVIPD